MVNCYCCGKKIGFFSNKYDYEDAEGNLVKYCFDCNNNYLDKLEKDRKKQEKKQKERRKQAKKEQEDKLKNKLNKEKTITPFIKENIKSILILNCNLQEIKLDEHLFEKKYGYLADRYYSLAKEEDENKINKYISIIKSAKINNFLNIFIQKELFSTIDEELIKKSEFQTINILNSYECGETFSNNGKNETVHTFFKLISKKYGNISMKILLEVMNEKYIEYLIDEVNEQNIQTKEEYYTYLIKRIDFLDEDSLKSLKTNLELNIFLNDLKRKKLVNNNLTFKQFQNDLLMWNEDKEISEFENQFIEDEDEQIIIKDINKIINNEQKIVTKVLPKISKEITNFNKRYTVVDQKYSNLKNLTRLINTKYKYSFSEEEVENILSIEFKEKYIVLFNKRLSKSKNLSQYINNFVSCFINELSKYFDQLEKELDFEFYILFEYLNYTYFIDYFLEFLDKKNIKYVFENIKNEIELAFDTYKAKEFENKLTHRNKITMNKIEKMNGFEFEELIGRLFKQKGYSIKLTKKTGDQGADLIITKKGSSIAIQAKRYSGNVSNSAIQEVVASMKYYDCDKAMVITTGKFTKSAIKLAEINEVELIDKNKLGDMFNISLS